VDQVAKLGCYHFIRAGLKLLGFKCREGQAIVAQISFGLNQDWEEIWC
jgi:hypothetical protein